MILQKYPEREPDALNYAPSLGHFQMPRAFSRALNLKRTIEQNLIVIIDKQREKFITCK